ncbi:MAG: ABATE domain-containing protein [Myxococcota bacterium]
MTEPSADDDLPLLGEALAIELANTRYGAGADAVDFLGPELAGRWARAALGGDGALSGAQLESLRVLRDAVRVLVEATWSREAPPPDAVAAVNRAAAGCSTRAALTWAPHEGPRARVVFDGPPFEVALARAATSAIETLTHERPIRRCEGPGCTLWFVVDHGRRRFCHDGCSHRARQRRYTRSRR